MALEILYINENRIEGVLDGLITFHLQKSKGKMTAKIADWKREHEIHEAEAQASMRSTAYEMLARYRESQRASLAY